VDLSFSPAEQALAAEVRAWLATNMDPPPAFDDMAAEVEWGRAWQSRLAEARWVGIHWPREYGGRGSSPVEVAIFNTEYARARAPQPVNRVGINNAGPTILAHGTEEQKRRWLAPILTAEEIWCQLFSEPGAGSDLAALSTRAVPDDDGWVLNGQKVWTSYAQFARWGICLARTDPDAPKHRGISYLVVDMSAPGIEIRPLVQITGEAEFNEVFFETDHLVGGLHQGWAVANTTLAHERGTNFLFKEQVVHEVLLDELWRLAEETDRLDDPLVADALTQSYVELRALRLHNWRTLTRLGRGDEPGPKSSIGKLLWTDMTQHLSDTGLVVAPTGAKWQRQWLWSRAASIAGGTSEIQRSIIGDRILGLPR
jgi:alkylation response protein AidB-like acyl-CoA dehydrogenase